MSTLEDCINAYRIKIIGLNDLINIIKAKIIPIKFGITKSNFLIILILFLINIINEKLFEIYKFIIT